MDKLNVKGLGKPLDGEHEFDLGNLLGIGTPDALTNRECHRIKVISGVRVGELEDALIAGDTDVLVALAAIILTRKGLRVDEEKLWDAPAGSGLQFEFGVVEEADADDPPVEPAATPETSSTSGGKSSTLTLAPQANGQSPIGPLDLAKSVTSGQVTSAT